MSSYVVGKDIQAIVADIGSFSTKIGYAGDDHPTAIYNSTTAVQRRRRPGGSNDDTNCGGDNSSSSSSNFINGPKRDFATRTVDTSTSDGDYELVNPIDPVTGWAFNSPKRTNYYSPPSTSSSFASNDNAGNNDKLGDAWESHELISRYLEHAFQHGLGLGGGTNGSAMDDCSKHHPLLLLDKPHTPPAIRQRLCEILFETHDLPAVFFLRDAIASCYAVGRTTATVVDVGYSSTMVTPVYEGFVETRGVLRNNACSAHATEEHVLQMMDDIVKKQGGRKRKERLRRISVKKLEQQQVANSSNNANASSSSPDNQGSTKKRDSSGHFVKPNQQLQPPSLSSIPDCLMPLYQVRRTPSYTPRSTPFHNWSRMTLAREIKESGLGVAVGPLGYVTSATAAAAAAAATNAAAGGISEGGETGQVAGENNLINPATANSMFLTSSKLPYKLRK